MLHDGMKEYEIGIVRAAQVKCNFKLRKSKLRLVETVRAVCSLYKQFDTMRLGEIYKEVFGCRKMQIKRSKPSIARPCCHNV